MYLLVLLNMLVVLSVDVIWGYCRGSHSEDRMRFCIINIPYESKCYHSLSGGTNRRLYTSGHFI